MRAALRTALLLTAIAPSFQAQDRTPASHSAWPTPRGWQDAYDFVQNRRAEAEKLWKKKDAAGVDLLLETLPFLDQPLVRDLAAGNKYLAARRANIYLDLAQAYALSGQRDLSLSNLRKFLAGTRYAGSAASLEREPDFASLRNDPEFQRIMAEDRQVSSLWESAAFKTPYRENLSDAEKIAGLSKFWSEVKYNFGYPEKLAALDWDRLYLEWIPRVRNTQSTLEYYREMMLLCARLNDGHTNVYAPAEIDIYAKPPLRTGLVEGRVMILEVRSPSLEAKGVRRGMEILAVDGEAAVTYARRDIEPYQSAATPQDRDVKTFWYGFLRGPASQSLRLRLRDADGRESEVEVARNGYRDTPASRPFAWRMLSGNIACVTLDSFESDQTAAEWRQAFPEISQAAGIVLDIRKNGGGSSEVGYAILQDLTAKPFLGSAQRTRKYDPTERARGILLDFTETPAEPVTPRPNGYTKNPVVVLSGPATFSAAEDFLVAWKNSGRGITIGEASGGSTGQPLAFSLPGGGSARVCTKKDTFPDGQEWVGKGIEPDLVVRPTLADVREGRDTVLERALVYLARGQ